jgi:hypothetical protein
MPTRPGLKRIAQDFSKKDSRALREEKVEEEPKQEEAEKEPDAPAINSTIVYFLIFVMIGRYGRLHSLRFTVWCLKSNSFYAVLATWRDYSFKNKLPLIYLFTYALTVNHPSFSTLHNT